MSSSWASVGSVRLKKEDVFHSGEGSLGLEAAVSFLLLCSKSASQAHSPECTWVSACSSTFRKISPCCWKWFPTKMSICSLTRSRPSALDCLSHKWFMVSLSWSFISQFSLISSLNLPGATIPSCSIMSVQKGNWPCRPKFIFQSLKSLRKRVKNCQQQKGIDRYWMGLDLTTEKLNLSAI